MPVGPDFRQMLNTRWTLRSFVVEGQYCPTSVIQAQLGAIKRAACAEAAMLVVVLRSRPFRSLLLVSAADDHAVARTHKRILSSLSTRHTLNSEQLVQLGRASDIGTICRVLGVPDAEPSACVPCTSCAIDATQQLSASLFVALFGTATSPESAKKELDQLHLMVHATVAVATRRHYVIERLCDDHEIPVEQDMADAAPVRAFGRAMGGEHWRDQTYGRFASSALEVAMKATQSDGASFYRLSRETNAIDGQFPIHLGIRSNTRETDVPTEVRVAFRSNQPVMEHSSGSGGAAGVQTARLAFPIAFRRYGTRTRDSLAVLLLEKRGGSVYRGFTAWDIEILRAIGTHFRQHRDLLRLHESTSLLTHLAKHSTSSTHKVPDALNQFFCFEDKEHFKTALQLKQLPTAHENNPSALPIEAKQCKRQIADALDGLYELTRSRSVSLRLVTTNGRYLLRCCSLWTSPFKDPGHLLNVDRHWRTSANAWSVMTGKPCDIANIHQPEVWKKIHPKLERVFLARGAKDELKSLYCTPVFCGGRVVGTVNVESVYPAAFTVTKMLVDAVACQIGQLLEKARGENERLLHIASPIGDVVHAAAKLNAYADNLSKDTRMHLETQSIVSCVKSITSMLQDPVDTDIGHGAIHQTLGDIIQNVLDIAQVINCQLVQTPALAICPFVVLGKVVAFQRTLRELLHNARLRCDGHRQGIQITCGTKIRGGSEWLTVQIGNPYRTRSEEVLTPDSIGQYGRLPLFGHGRAHWGALRAGATARRQLDGDIYISTLDQNYFAVVIEIPNANKQEVAYDEPVPSESVGG